MKRPTKQFRKKCSDGGARVCVCVKTSENLSFYISGITLLIELKFGVHLKQSLISFSHKLIHGLGFHDDFNFV